jgi:hypothetical protein
LDLSGVNLNNVVGNSNDRSKSREKKNDGQINLGQVKVSPKAQEENKTAQIGGGKFDISKLSKFINMDKIDVNKLGGNVNLENQKKNAKSSMASDKRPDNNAMFSQLLEDVTFIPDARD